MSLIRGDAVTIPLADESVDLIVTSPPYFALRSYTDDGDHYAGQIGSEATPAAFIDALIAVTRECVRVLKPSGSLFVNLGDKYASSGTRQGSEGLDPSPGLKEARTHYGKRPAGFRDKSLMGLPWRYALRCIDDLGLILRAEIIWSKPNGLPESVQDRVRRSHEQWFHFTLEPRYYSAVDEIRESYSERVQDRERYAGRDVPPRAPYAADNRNDSERPAGILGFGKAGMDPLGKLPGSVWTVPTEPLRVPDHLPQHFAAFPSEWPRRIILGWSPTGICTVCGEGRRPVVDQELMETQIRSDDRNRPGRMDGARHGDKSGWNGNGYPHGYQLTSITGESCACRTPFAPTRPAVVLDPFCGTGTTPAVANTLGRFGVGIDLSADYLKLARWRCQDPGLRAKVLGVDKPAPEVPGQMALL